MDDRKLQRLACKQGHPLIFQEAISSPSTASDLPKRIKRICNKYFTYLSLSDKVCATQAKLACPRQSLHRSAQSPATGRARSKLRTRNGGVTLQLPAVVTPNSCKTKPHHTIRSTRIRSMSSYTISELAREFSISTRTIRYYEEQGLLTSVGNERGGRKRHFESAERNRLKSALRARRLGMTVSEIKNLIDPRQPEKISSEQLKKKLCILKQMRDRLTRRHADVEATIADLVDYAKTCRRQIDEPSTHRQPLAMQIPARCHPTGG